MSELESELEEVVRKHFGGVAPREQADLARKVLAAAAHARGAEPAEVSDVDALLQANAVVAMQDVEAFLKAELPALAKFGEDPLPVETMDDLERLLKQP
jgi:hypothetical protein